MIPFQQPPYRNYTLTVQPNIFLTRLRAVTEQYGDNIIIGFERDRSKLIWNQINGNTFRLRQKYRPNLMGEQSTYAPWLYGHINEIPNGCQINTWFSIDRARYIHLSIPLIISSILMCVFIGLSIWFLLRGQFIDFTVAQIFLIGLGIFWYTTWYMYKKMRIHPQDSKVLINLLEIVVESCHTNDNNQMASLRSVKQ